MRWSTRMIKKNADGFYAPAVFDLIVKMAWTNGSRALCFWTVSIAITPVPSSGRWKARTPCGEQPLLPFESCNLGSINLDAMLIRKGGGYELDYEEFEADDSARGPFS